MNSQKLVYVNGRMVPEHEASVSLFDVGRLYGAAFYESIRTFGHKLFRLEAHYHRLKASLRYAGILDALDFSRVTDAVSLVLDANVESLDPENDIWICVEVTPGTAFPMPLQSRRSMIPTVVAYGSELPYREYAKYYQEGKAAVTSVFRNIPPESFSQRCKNRSRLSHYLSKVHCGTVNPDAFSLMLDLHGNITEGTGANVFFVFDGVLVTPTTKNILNGISRCFIIDLAHQEGIPFEERDITLFEAYTADEAFWTTTSYCVLPMSSVDARPFSSTVPGPITEKLLDAWSAAVGVDIVGQARMFS